MEIQAPSKRGYTIYTKTGCSYCKYAKQLLQNENPAVLMVDCDEYLLTDKEVFLEEMVKYTHISHRTFPMIFYKGLFIGGFTELKTSYELKTADKRGDVVNS